MTNQNIRYKLWRRYWENPSTKKCSMNEFCYVCGHPLKFEDFEAGHIEANKENGIDNLVPICNSCNNGMKQENLIDYKSKHFPNILVNCFWTPERDYNFAKARTTLEDTLPEIIEILSTIEIDNNLENITEAIKFVTEDYYERHYKPKRIELTSFQMEEMRNACDNCEYPNSCKERKCKYYYGENVEIFEK